MKSLEAIAPIAEVIVALSTLIVTTVLTVLVYFGTRQIANIEYWRTVRDAWMQLDSIALSNDETLRIADSLFHPNLAHQQTADDRRNRWLGLMALNTLLSMYFGPSGSLPNLNELRRATLLQMQALVTDDVFYDLTQSGLYDPEFEEACRKLRREEGSATD